MLDDAILPGAVLPEVEPHLLFPLRPAEGGGGGCLVVTGHGAGGYKGRRASEGGG